GQPVPTCPGTVHVRAATVCDPAATVHEPTATVHTAAVIVQFRLTKAPGPERAASVLTATVRTGTVGNATGGGEASILKGTVRMEGRVVAEPDGTVRRAGGTPQYQTPPGAFRSVRRGKRSSSGRCGSRRGVRVERSGPADPGVEDGPGPFESQPTRRLQQMRQALGLARQTLHRMRGIHERLVEESEEPDHPAVGTRLDSIAGALGLLAQPERLVASGAGQHGREQQ